MAGYNYSSVGAYFITIVTYNREHLFGEIFNGTMVLNGLGKVAEQCWMDIPNHFPFVSTDQFVVMPNHIHGIIIINESVEANDYSPLQSDSPTPIGNPVEAYNHTPLPCDPPIPVVHPVKANGYSPLPTVPPTPPFITPKFRSPSKTIGSIVRGFKIGVTKWAKRSTAVENVWQPNYHDHIIRDEKSLISIRQYIYDNPRNWVNDNENKL
ncbi:MAG: transposase [Bacteroidales bacterium]